MPSENDYRRTLRLQKLGRFLSLLLKHHSTRFPVQLDPEGYASFKDVMHILNRLPNFRWATTVDVKAVLDLPGLQRFEILEGQEEGKRIRALTGHTIDRPEYEPVTPPDVLYHATAPENLDAVKNEGLLPADRQYVHLTATPASARSVALRITPDPVILRIDAATAYAAGHHFYCPTPGIYLTDAIPQHYIQEHKND
jgi:putative RNA 2'-phosphotransferase